MLLICLLLWSSCEYSKLNVVIINVTANNESEKENKNHGAYKGWQVLKMKQADWRGGNKPPQLQECSMSEREWLVQRWGGSPSMFNTGLERKRSLNPHRWVTGKHRQESGEILWRIRLHAHQSGFHLEIERLCKVTMASAWHNLWVKGNCTLQNRIFQVQEANLKPCTVI